MDKTPKPSKSLRTLRNPLPGTSNESASCTTPHHQTRMFAESENDDSPVHIACTQEGYDNVDVVWDWNSPRAKQQPKKTKKRLILSQSPKVPMKRHSSNNQIQNFEKLREELQALREAIAVPDNEESLVLSPVEEAKYKGVTEDQNMNDVPPPTQEIYFNDEDMFNDSADEDLILCTQKIEAELEAKQCNNNQIVRVNSNLHSVKKSNGEQDCFTKKLVTEHLEYNKVCENYNQTTKSGTDFSFTRTLSENQYKSRQSGKVEFHRTQSFESTVEYTKAIPRNKLEEIERKRKEALAKLEAKRRQEHSESPSKCSPEEIERKRLEALAKLEAKRQQEIIERKRQEALKRLELSRMKNAGVVKSSLYKRM